MIIDVITGENFEEIKADESYKSIRIILQKPKKIVYNIYNIKEPIS